MLETIIILAVLTGLFWIGFKITGAILSAVIWLFIKLPLALCFLGIGIVAFITILLIPFGKWCFKTAGKLVCP